MTDKPTYAELEKRVKELEQLRFEHRLLAENLRKSEEKYKLLTEQSADIIYKLNIETDQYTYISPSIERVLGYTVEEGLSLKAQDTVTTESYNQQAEKLIEAISNNQMVPEILELEAIHKDGHTLPVETHANFILDERENPVEILGVVRDITKRKQAEKALQESESKYQDLYDNAPDMFVSVDANKGTMLECNRTFTDVLGYTKEEVIGCSVFDIYTPDSAEHAKSTLFPLFVKTGSIKGEELRVLKKDGSTLEVSLNVSAIRDANGNIVQGRSILRDISEQKQLKEERENLIQHLQDALNEIKALRGILPICSFCKRVRDDQGYWERVDIYLQKHSLADISHGICPECTKKHYPEVIINEN
jgi:PAS domain S-box-containing protein